MVESSPAEPLAGARRSDQVDAHSRSSAQTTPAAMFTLNEKGEILAASPSVADMFGSIPEDLAGLEFAQLISEPYRREWEAEFRRTLRRDEGADFADRRDILVHRKDDKGVFPVVLSTAAVVNGDVHRFVAVVHDRTRERDLERRLHDAEERERRRIGHELHDSVGGQLTGVEIASALLHRKLVDEESAHAEAAGELGEHLRELHKRLRAVSRGLLPVEDDPLGLTTALRRLVKTNHGHRGARCLFRCDGEVSIDDIGVSTNLYYIAEEAVQNAVRHARATLIVVELNEPEESHVVLEVRDDGVGISENAGVGSGIGMESMAHRAKLIEANLEIAAVEPSGTRVRCFVDVSKHQYPT